MNEAEEWNNWIDMGSEYRKSIRKIREYRLRLKKKNDRTINDALDIELVGNIESDLRMTIGEINKRKCLDLRISEQDMQLVKLTDRQRQIIVLCQDQYSYSEIAQKLGITRQSVTDTYLKTFKKIRKAKEQKKNGMIPGLSDKEQKVYQLHKKGFKNSQIAEKLNTSTNYVSKTISKIKKNITKIT